MIQQTFWTLERKPFVVSSRVKNQKFFYTISGGPCEVSSNYFDFWYAFRCPKGGSIWVIWENVFWRSPLADFEISKTHSYVKSNFKGGLWSEVFRFNALLPSYLEKTCFFEGLSIFRARKVYEGVEMANITIKYQI